MYVTLIGLIVAVLPLYATAFWLLFDRADMADRCDQATDDADNALGRVVAVEHHLAETEPASDGRHAR